MSHNWKDDSVVCIIEKELLKMTCRLFSSSPHARSVFTLFSLPCLPFFFLLFFLGECLEWCVNTCWSAGGHKAQSSFLLKSTSVVANTVENGNNERPMWSRWFSLSFSFSLSLFSSLLLSLSLFFWTPPCPHLPLMKGAIVSDLDWKTHAVLFLWGLKNFACLDEKRFALLAYVQYSCTLTHPHTHAPAHKYEHKPKHHKHITHGHTYVHNRSNKPILTHGHA